jgi:hypothetical protein
MLGKDRKSPYSVYHGYKTGVPKNRTSLGEYSGVSAPERVLPQNQECGKT